MRTEFRRDLQHSYLVIYMEEKNASDYSSRMLGENPVKELLSVDFRRMDQQTLLYYDITSKIPVSEYCALRKIQGQEIVRLLYCFLDTLSAMEEYLLDGNGLYLHPDYIYFDADARNAQFCFVPGRSEELGKQFRELMEFLLPVLDHQNREEMLAVYDIYEYAVTRAFSVEGLYQVLRKTDETGDAAGGEEDGPEEEREVSDILSEEEALERERQRALQSFFGDEEEDPGASAGGVWMAVGVLSFFLAVFSGWYIWRNWPQYGLIWVGVCTAAVAGCLGGARLWNYLKNKKSADGNKEMDLPVKTENAAEWKDAKREAAEWKALYRDKTEWEKAEWEAPGRMEEDCRDADGCGTRPLAGGGSRGPCLQEQSPHVGRRYSLLNQEIQIVGHQKNRADLVLESCLVSRMHARIRRESGKYYLSDLNSKNGTWVNGKQLAAKEEVLLCAGDEVRFADQSYVFLEEGS